MKGVILAGGLGTRLRPATLVSNKHLQLVYDHVMIDYPLASLTRAGVKNIMVVTGEEHAGQFVKYLGNGLAFGCKIVYGFQKGNGGIAEAIGIAEDFFGSDPVIAINGDNYFEDDITPFVREFARMKKGGLITLYRVADPRRHGVARLKNGKVVEVVEKPKDPPSHYMVPGLYMYDNRVFGVIKTLKPSARGELEITDLHNFYIADGTLRHKILKKKWFDMGTFDSLLEAANYFKKKRR